MGGGGSRREAVFPVPTSPPTPALHQAPPTSPPTLPPAPGPWGHLVQAVSPQGVKSPRPRQEPGQRSGPRLGPGDSAASSMRCFLKCYLPYYFNISSTGC